MTITVTHRNEDIVMYIRRQGGRYMNMSESEYRDFTSSLDEVNEKIRQCKMVMAGKLPAPLDVEEQSSTLAKSKATLKLEKDRSRLAKAKRRALSLLEESVSDDDETEPSAAPQESKKVRRSSGTNRKVNRAVSLVGGTDEEDSDAI